MGQLYSRIAEEARHEYVLAYEPRGKDRDANYHRVKLSVMREGMAEKGAPQKRGAYRERRNITHSADSMEA